MGSWIHGDPTVLGRRELMSSQQGVLPADPVAEAGRETLGAPPESLFVPRTLSLKSRLLELEEPCSRELELCILPSAQSLAWGPRA